MLSAVVGVILNPMAAQHWDRGLWGLLGIACAASAAAVINHYIDQRIDQKMQRTAVRPLAVDPQTGPALLFAGGLALTSILILSYFTNPLTTWFTFGAMIGYAVIYTAWLKHQTPQNIVIGGITGALPPLLGWTAIDGTMGPAPWLLVIIIFLWTPPHFWALAIYRIDDYAKSGLPMLCNTHGVAFTKNSIVQYSILTTVATYLPACIGMSGLLYAAAVTPLNWIWLRDAWRLRTNPDPKSCACAILYILSNT